MTAGRFRLLMVDDAPTLGKLRATALRREGFECALASSAIEAQQVIRESAFDAVMSDYHLEGLPPHRIWTVRPDRRDEATGLALLRSVRAIPRRTK